jgi:photosystem II stability/assembly factor-like uncharacterized protein
VTQFVREIVAAAPSTLYCTTDGAGVWTATAGTDSWTAASNGLNGSSITQIATDPSDPLILYAAVDGGGISKSLDGGNQWSAANDGIPEGHINGIVIDPSRPRTLYAYSRFSGVLKSVDAGGSWRDASKGLPLVTETLLGPSVLSITSLTVDPADSATLYLGTTRPYLLAGVFKSTDGGESWEATPLVPTSASIAALAVDPTDTATVYAVGTNGSPFFPVGSMIYRTRDGGSTWASFYTGSCDVRTLTVDRFNSSTLYAADLGGICRSTDRGESWQGASTVYLPPANQILVDTTDSSTIYAATGDYYRGIPGGVFWSRDGGATWDQLGMLPSSIIYSLALDSRGWTLYAGSRGGGVFSLDLSQLRLQVAPTPVRARPRSISPRG